MITEEQEESQHQLQPKIIHEVNTERNDIEDKELKALNGNGAEDGNGEIVSKSPSYLDHSRIKVLSIHQSSDTDHHALIKKYGDKN